MFKSRLLVLCLVAALLAACTPGAITGSGNVVTREEAFTGFDWVDITHGFDVDITQGEAFSVVIRLDDNLVQYLRVLVIGRTLNIGLNRDRVYNLQNATLRAEVTMPELTRIAPSDGSHVTISAFKSTKALNVEMSGGSELRGDVVAGDVHLYVSGGSHATLSGSGQDLKVEASEGSGVNLGDLSVVDADVDASGGSEATVNPSGRLDAAASVGSRVYYLGSPTLGVINTDATASVEPK